MPAVKWNENNNSSKNTPEAVYNIKLYSASAVKCPSGIKLQSHLEKKKHECSAGCARLGRSNNNITPGWACTPWLAIVKYCRIYTQYIHIYIYHLPVGKRKLFSRTRIHIHTHRGSSRPSIYFTSVFVCVCVCVCVCGRLCVSVKLNRFVFFLFP